MPIWTTTTLKIEYLSPNTVYHYDHNLSSWLSEDDMAQDGEHALASRETYL